MQGAGSAPATRRVPAEPLPSRKGPAVADAVLVLLLLPALGAAVLLAVRALRYWYGQRAGRVYELPVDHRGTLLRAGASGVTALLAATLAVPLLHDAGAVPGRTRAVAARISRPTAVPPTRVRTPAGTPAPAPPPELRLLGHPAGGTLEELRDGTRVWLPHRYTTPAAAGVAYPVVIVHASSLSSPSSARSSSARSSPSAVPSGSPSPGSSSGSSAARSGSSAAADLYSAFAAQTDRGRANSFLLVTPPSCTTDSAAVLTEVAARYRTLTARTAHGVIGFGTQAPCAVREALSHPDRYAAAVGISGDYPAIARPAGRYPSLLLAAATTQTAQRASAVRLRSSLGATGDQVRLFDGVRSARDLPAKAAAYFTEKLDSPARTPTASLTPTPRSPFAPSATPTPTAPAAPKATSPAGPPRRPSTATAPARTPASAPGTTSAAATKAPRAPHSAPAPRAPSAPHSAPRPSASSSSAPPPAHRPATAP